jgi:hypothetical protein
MARKSPLFQSSFPATSQQQEKNSLCIQYIVGAPSPTSFEFVQLEVPNVSQLELELLEHALLQVRLAALMMS